MAKVKEFSSDLRFFCLRLGLELGLEVLGLGLEVLGLGLRVRVRVRVKG